MSGETERNVSGWTVDTLSVHIEELRVADARLLEERDRRYAEVADEREKALRIKEQGDRDALLLAREIQTYKDEKANELRSQIERERGSYATQGDLKGAIEKLEETIKPIAAYVAAQSGPRAITPGQVAAVIAALAVAVGLFFAVRNNTKATPVTPVILTPPVTTTTATP